MANYTTSGGKVISIAEMNDFHLDNAIKKLRALPSPLPPQQEMLRDLEAEQARRGGPPWSV